MNSSSKLALTITLVARSIATPAVVRGWMTLRRCMVLNRFSLLIGCTVLRGFLALSGFVLESSARGGDWTQFRGGAALSCTTEASLPNTWSSTEHVAWRTPIPGSGWSQPVVLGNQVFLTTAVSPQGRRPKGMLAGAIDPTTLGKGHRTHDNWEWKVICLDLQDGHVVWEQTAVTGEPTHGIHASNTYATETPTVSPAGVQAFFGATGTLVSYSLQGQEQWRHELGPQSITNQFGTGSSPLLYGSQLFLQLFNEEQSQLLSWDIARGDLLWKSTGPKGTSWSTPIIWHAGETTQVVTAGQGTVTGFDPQTGAEIWRLGGLDTSFSCSLVADAQTLFAGTASPGSSAPLYAIAAGSKGDLTLPSGSTSSAAIRWSRKKSGAGMPSPIVVDDYLFFIGSTVTCYHKTTGEEVYRKRMPGGRMAAACPVVVDGLIYIVNEIGTTVVIPAGPEFKVVAQHRLDAQDEVFWATPAVGPNCLLIRSSDAVYCVR